MAIGGAQTGLRVSRKALGLPFRIGKRVRGIFSPRRKAKKWARRIRRVTLVVVVLMILAAMAPAAMVLSGDRGQELAALMAGPLGAQQQTRGGGCPATDPACTATPIGEALGTVQGIPYAEVFNSAGRETGVDPRLLAAVAWAESGFAEDVIDCQRSSRAGAQGIMQLMPGTARLLRVDACKPDEAIPGGARYLKQQKDEFGTWENALAAYNWGPGAFAQWARDPETITRPQENIQYVRKVMGKWEEYQRQFPDEQITGGGLGNASADRQAIIQRAYAWLNEDCSGRQPTDPYQRGCGVAYSMNPPYHSSGYRRDCSGYVSMAWGLSAPGTNTVGMGNGIAEPIDKSELQPGDILLKPLAGANGHVVMFEGWVDDDTYWGLEQVGGSTRETIRRQIPYPYFNSNAYSPYRWERLAGSGGGGGGASNSAE